MDDRTMRFSKLAYFGIGVAFLVLLVILGVSLWGLHQTVKGFESIIHTEKLSDQLMHLFSDLKEAEDDQRLFLLTGESQYLSAYQAATKRIDQEIHTVNSLVDANTPLHEKVFPLQNLVRERLALLQEVIDVYENQSLEKAISLIRTGRGMRTMEKIRDLILGLDQEDTAFLGHQHHLVHRMERLTLLTMITGIGLILLTGFLTIWKLKRDLTERLLLEHRLFEETKLAELARLLGDIGHDIKNMLTPITMGTELLEQELDEYFNQLPETDRSKGKSTQEMSKEVIEMTRTGSKRIQERVRKLPMP
jgi:CHASE3 domain sensor protein